MANRLPQELRRAGIHTTEQANRFLCERYIAEFNRIFAKPAREKGTAFRKCNRKDLDQVFSIQTERTMDNDNTMAIRDQLWQLERPPFRHAGRLARDLCEHLDGTVFGALGRAHSAPV